MNENEEFEYFSESKYVTMSFCKEGKISIIS